MRRVTILALAAVTVFLAAWGVITLYDYQMTAGRMWETPTVRPYEEPILAMDPGLVPVNGGETRFRLIPGDALASPLESALPETVVPAGKALYATYCQQCHGVNHDGMGTVGQSFAPLPGDLRSAKVQNLTEGMVFKEISFGIPDGRQPALATTISVMDRWRIVAYVKSLGVRKTN
jgi:mono/diheme cytochrome c family protein